MEGEQQRANIADLKPRSTYEVVDIETVSEDNPFHAHGYSYLKVSRGDVTRAIRVKIQGLPQELVDKSTKMAPKPPSVTKMLDPDSPEGRELGVRTRQKAIVPDFTDAEYQQKLEAHNIAFRQQVVGHGVISNLKLGGALANTPDEKYRALEAMGLSSLHFNQLAEDVLNLTKWTEAEVDRYFRG